MPAAIAIIVVAVLIPAGLLLYKKKPALFTTENFLKLLDFSAKVLEKVVAILEVVKKIADVTLEIKEAYDRMKEAEKAAQDQWKLQVQFLTKT
ncbi:uncharacterized protein BO87DRAFT_431730 [Aspergillus neoniger CBS 115656]|uniref:Uncharacterized protein n=1 Tax=Aspergillus neoniger (strain CBS 115656) TaxID=1448310 RepID=A0A318Y375_ASPNB|nr:hypothetical protein BO87DRAFT_431730 [Aspergillus neoniger CBS 115656]PYH28204.1 hypothetical protein BO87DRAFT_431730 [Aspergillus neoniger CBS 115656]